MARYEQSDLVFDVPREWDDRSVVAFAAPAKAGRTSSANFVVTREAFPLNGSLKTQADKQLIELSRRLDRFDLKERAEITVGGLPAEEIRFTWAGQGGTVLQRMIMVARKRTMLTFTATVPKGEAAQVDGIFDRIVGSIQFPDAVIKAD